MTHDANGGHDDIWNYIEGIRTLINGLDGQVADLQVSVDAHGEVLDAVRNRVYALEHGQATS